MPKRRPRLTDAEILRASYEASERTQRSFAIDVLGCDGLSGFTAWIAHQNPRPAPGPAVRLAWILCRHPELVAEIDAAFRQSGP